MNLILHFVNARDTITVPAGQVIFHEGDRGAVMYVILEGSASIVVADQVVEIAGPGGIIGELALVDDDVRSATCIAMSACRLISVGRAEFHLLVRERPEFARHVMKVIARRLRRMNSAMAGMAPMPHVDDTVRL